MYFFENDMEFYPTPSDVASKMVDCVDFRTVRTVLEPSAGKGDLLKALKTKLDNIPWRMIPEYACGRYDDLYIDAIEPNMQLVNALKENVEQKVCWHDFLSFQPSVDYDLILMNPPFSNGDSHLLKAIELIESNGGQIVCLLNKETIQNQFSAKRKLLAKKLSIYDSKIEDLGSCFYDAERKTLVEVVMIYINIPQRVVSYFKENFEVDYTDNVSTQHNNNALVDSDPIKAILSHYQHELNIGKAMFKEFSILQENDYLEEFSLKINDKPATLKRFLHHLRRKYWTRYFSSDELAARLPDEVFRDYQSRIRTEFVSYDFSLTNILKVRNEMAQNLTSVLKEKIMSTFDEFTREYAWYPESSHNVHYFNGWATNECYKIGKKVILPINTYSKWSDRIRVTEAIRPLSDIERCLAFFDVGTKSDCGYIADVLRNADDLGQTKKITLKYFDVSFYKKGTCHITFTRPEVIKSFNLYAAKQRGWLPPSYGKKSYDDMDQKSKEVIDSFEGKEEYTRFFECSEKTVLQGNTILMLHS